MNPQTAISHMTKSLYTLFTSLLNYRKLNYSCPYFYSVRYIGCKGGERMIKSLSAKFVFEALDESGKEVLKSRTVGRLSVNTENKNLLDFSQAYGNLKGEQYVNVLKVTTEAVR